MRIVILGGAGFIGSHVAKALQDHEIVIVDDFSTGRESHIPESAELWRQNLTTLSLADMNAFLEEFQPEAVIHLAAMHFIPDCMARPERTFAVNVGTTHTLVQALMQRPVKTVVFASTLDVYAAADRVHYELDILEPANIYGLSKSLSEDILAFGHRAGMCESAVALRLANVYGPGETNPHLIPDALDRIVHRNGDESALIMGYLGATRDFVFVEDVAAAFQRAALLSPSGFHRLNVGTGHPVAVREVVKALQILQGDTRPLQENPAVFRKFDRPSLTPDVHRIADVLGWQASTTLRAGLSQTIANALRAAA
jgi:UDP-glucose 4-epimerase